MRPYIKLVFELHKSFYGLKQSGRNWNTMLHTYLSKKGFQQNPTDHGLYTRERDKMKQ